MNPCPPLGLEERWLLGWQGYVLLAHLSGCVTEEISLSKRRAGEESAVPGRGRRRTGCKQPIGLAALLPHLESSDHSDV